MPTGRGRFAVTFATGLVTGTANSLILKSVFQTKSLGLDGNVSYFSKPWCMSLLMFLAMLAALPMYFISPGFLSNRESNEPTVKVHPKIWAILSIPSMLDLLGTTFQAIGLLYVPLSAFQMLKGSVLVFSAILSVVFLQATLQKHHVVGLSCCTAALFLIGTASVASRDAQIIQVTLTESFTGLAIILSGQILCASQYVLEEFFLKEPNDVPPLALVGAEGFWGCMFMSLLFLPLIGSLPGSDAGLVVENCRDTLAKLQNNEFLIALCSIFCVTVFVFNICGILITQIASAIHHTFLDASRTIFVWIASVGLYYSFPGASLGEPLTPFSVLQVAGFGILLYGQCVYDRIVDCPFLDYDSKDSSSYQGISRYDFRSERTGSRNIRNSKRMTHVNESPLSAKLLGEHTGA